MSLRDLLPRHATGPTAEARLNAYCRSHPDAQADTVRDLARMRAQWQHVSYDTALGQLLDAMEKFG
jgi:hypothetical protein